MPLVINTGRSGAGRRGDCAPAPIAGQIAWAVVLLALIAIAFAKLAR